MSNTRAKAALAGSRFADLRWVPDTDSTNTDVQHALVSAAQADPGSRTELVIVADHQRSGRGRLDRTWEAPPEASLLMSVGTTATVADDHRGLILSAMSLAGVDAIEAICGVEVGVKWPNDLVSDPRRAARAEIGPGEASSDGIGSGEGASESRKVAGILAEAVVLPDRRTGFVVGIGINCNWGGMPESLAGTATSLDILGGIPVDRADLVVGIVEGFARRLELLEGARGDELLAEAREHSATLGTEVVAHVPGGELRGRAVDLDHDGALLVDTRATGPGYTGSGDGDSSDGDSSDPDSSDPDSNRVIERVTVGDVVHLR